RARRASPPSAAFGPGRDLGHPLVATGRAAPPHTSGAACRDGGRVAPRVPLGAPLPHQVGALIRQCPPPPEPARTAGAARRPVTPVDSRRPLVPAIRTPPPHPLSARPCDLARIEAS